MLACAFELLTAVMVATAPPAGSTEQSDGDDWYSALAQAAASAIPLVHGIVAAGSEQCEMIKRILGVSYEQLQARNTPDTDSSLSIHFVTSSGVQKFNITSAKVAARRADFNPRNKLVVLIHGFMENSEGMMTRAISEPLLEKPGYTVMALDGGELIRMLYFRSSTYVRFMGVKLGEFLAELVKEGQNPDTITIIGHSLGAHIAGISGKTYQRITGSKIGRITGLDPAGPCFTSANEDSKLRRGDATYVDVIHTDGGLLGLKEAIGDKDFFPNGGSVQPGCGLPPCCHSRAWQLYADSVREEFAFPARLCPNWRSYQNGSCSKNVIAYMGIRSESGANGLYYLNTDKVVNVVGS